MKYLRYFLQYGTLWSICVITNWSIYCWYIIIIAFHSTHPPTCTCLDPKCQQTLHLDLTLFQDHSLTEVLSYLIIVFTHSHTRSIKESWEVCSKCEGYHCEDEKKWGAIAVNRDPSFQTPVPSATIGIGVCHCSYNFSVP